MIICKSDGKLRRARVSAQRMKEARLAERAWRKKIRAETAKCPMCGVESPKHFIWCVEASCVLYKHFVLCLEAPRTL